MLTDRERRILDLIAAWQKDHPDEFGPNIIEVEQDIEIVESLLGLEPKPIGGLMLDMKAKGLLETKLNTSDWRKPQCWRVVGLLDRMAHEADG